MNRAQCLIEIFEPSDERPTPEYQTRPPDERGIYQDFTYRLVLPGGTYDIGMTYHFYHRSLDIAYAKDLSFSPPYIAQDRSREEVERDTRDLIRVIRAMIQMVAHIRQTHDIHLLTFSSDTHFTTRLKLYSRLTHLLARSFDGRVLPERDIPLGRITIRHYGVQLKESSLFTTLRLRIIDKFSRH